MTFCAASSRGREQLQLLLDCSLVSLTARGTVVVRAIVHSGSRFVNSTTLARRVGLRDRHQLDRLLHNEGLPTYKELAGWIRVLMWVVEWEQSGMALSTSALNAGLSPEAYGRTVVRVTGSSWTEVRSRGSTWVLLELARRCHPAQLQHGRRKRL